MTDQIQPALSSDEWKELKADRRKPNGPYEHAVYIGQYGVCINDEEEYEGACVRESARHALAALCLHQQPYGFTQAMVDILRERACLGKEVMSAVSCPEEVTCIFCQIADRIEALLPPKA